MRNLMRIRIDTVWNKKTFVVESLESSRREMACGNFVEGIIPSHCPTKWVSCDVIETRNNSIKQMLHVAHAEAFAVIWMLTIVPTFMMSRINRASKLNFRATSLWLLNWRSIYLIFLAQNLLPYTRLILCGALELYSQSFNEWLFKYSI